MKLKKLVLLVIGVIFIMLIFPSCNNDDVIVTYDYNESPSTVNILSDHDIKCIDLDFKVTTKEFGEKEETISVKDIKANKKEELTTKFDNKDVTIENIEYTGYSIPLTGGEISFACSIIIFVVIIVMVLLVLTLVVWM